MDLKHPREGTFLPTISNQIYPNFRSPIRFYPGDILFVPNRYLFKEITDKAHPSLPIKLGNISEFLGGCIKEFSFGPGPEMPHHNVPNQDFRRQVPSTLCIIMCIQHNHFRFSFQGVSKECTIAHRYKYPDYEECVARYKQVAMILARYLRVNVNQIIHGELNPL